MKTAVITGGGTGIGRAVMERLNVEGWRVVVVGLACDPDFPGEVEFVRGDVGDTAAIIDSLSHLKKIDGLVHCAGILRHEREWQAEDFAAVMNINVTAGFALSTALLPRLEQASGAIVMMASMWSIFGSPGAPAYSASKGAVAAVTRSMAVAWAPRGVRVNAVAPGWVETTMTARARDDAARMDRINGRIPMGRWAKPSDIAAVIGFLLSSDASYVTGVVLAVDGGYSIC